MELSLLVLVVAAVAAVIVAQYLIARSVKHEVWEAARSVKGHESFQLESIRQLVLDVLHDVSALRKASAKAEGKAARSDVEEQIAKLEDPLKIKEIAYVKGSLEIALRSHKVIAATGAVFVFYRDGDKTKMIRLEFARTGQGNRVVISP